MFRIEVMTVVPGTLHREDVCVRTVLNDGINWSACVASLNGDHVLYGRGTDETYVRRKGEDLLVFRYKFHSGKQYIKLEPC